MNEPEELKDLSGLRCDLVDTVGKGLLLAAEVILGGWRWAGSLPLDPDNKDKFGLLRYVIGALLLA